MYKSECLCRYTRNFSVLLTNKIEKFVEYIFITYSSRYYRSALQIRYSRARAVCVANALKYICVASKRFMSCLFNGCK